MKVNATIKPKATEFKNASRLIRFDVSEEVVAAEVGSGQEDAVSYNYSEVKVSKTATYAEIVSAIIAEKYSLDKEIALINNQNQDTVSDEDIAEYTAYQDFRSLAKTIAKAVNSLELLDWNEIRDYAGTLDLSASGTREEIETAIRSL